MPPKRLWLSGEIFFWDLCQGFSELGHEVHLFAPGGSKVPPRGKLHYIPGSYGEINRDAEAKPVEWYGNELLSSDFILDCSHLRQVSEEIYFFYPQMRNKLLNVLNGISVPRVPYNIVLLCKRAYDLMYAGYTQFKGTPWESKYGGKAQPLNNGELSGWIHWACDANFYTPGEKCEGYLLWLGRPSPYKGLPFALKLAVKLDFPLKIVMPIEIEEHAASLRAYSNQIKQAQMKNSRIEIIHLPNNSQHHVMKRELIRRADALLYTISSEEPFGLIAIESLACGTPVIATRIGAMPEIIREGKTGYLCEMENTNEFGKAIMDIDKLDRRACREDAVQRFHYLQACKKYLELAEKLRCG